MTAWFALNICCRGKINLVIKYPCWTPYSHGVWLCQCSLLCGSENQNPLCYLITSVSVNQIVRTYIHLLDSIDFLFTTSFVSESLSNFNYQCGMNFMIGYRVTLKDNGGGSKDWLVVDHCQVLFICMEWIVWLEWNSDLERLNGGGYNWANILERLNGGGL